MKKLMLQDDNCIVEITLECDDPHIGAWLGPIQQALGGLGYHSKNIEDWFSGKYGGYYILGDDVKLGGTD
jgi:hypothetical protein